MTRAEDIENFVGITGASLAEATQMIDMCGDLENAVQLWYSDEDVQRSVRNNTSTSAAAAAATTASSSSRPNRSSGREDAQGVIHIDSDDDVPMTDNDDVGQFDDSDDEAANAAEVARAAQEEEDARVARQLQEELYGSGGGAGDSGTGFGEDGVRAPMARTTEQLIGPGGFAPGDDADDPQAAALLERMRRSARASRSQVNPFSRSVWDDNNAQPGATRGAQLAQSSRATRLAELFRPPIEFISPLSFDEARDEGKDGKKWIMVNLQDMSDFQCQALNRDIWKDEAIQALVRENFIFLQYDKDDKIDTSPEIYINRYLPNGQHENPGNFPHVSVIDPRTGEQVKVWNRSPFYNASEFLTEIAEFLDRYSLDFNSKNPVPKQKAAQPAVDLSRLSEEEMLRIAMQNSLETTNGTGSHQADVVDPDTLTQSVGDLGAEDKGKGKPAEEPTPPAPVEESAFSRIPSDRPHVEPVADPKKSTKLQIRYSGGRVIRRFLLDDKVQRIYEWLKSEPLEGKAGVDFELRAPPSSQDLIEKLDQTISEAGLANCTINIEFLED